MFVNQRKRVENLMFSTLYGEYIANSMAEKEGFEPSKPFWGLRDFQSRALDRTRRLLHIVSVSTRPKIV